MPDATEFKFNCPSCNQRILANTTWAGRKINCPSCKGRLTIPSVATKGGPAPQSKLDTPAKPPGKVTQKEKPQIERKRNSGFPPLPEGPRIATLTPAVKLEIIRAARSRIRSEAKWLPGRVNRANAYAAIPRDGEKQSIELVEATNPKATRHSLLGAVLLELHLRRVVRTATGRLRFLEREIPEAVREVLSGGKKADGKAEPKNDPMVLSHPECLAVLDVLEERFSHRLSQAHAERAKRLLKNVRLPDLVKKLEKQARISPEDVATALYHELMDVRRQLEQLESRSVARE